MFNKKTCKRCRRKIKKDFEFCPYCGVPANFDDRDWGMLGKNDLPLEEDLLSAPLLGGFSGKILNKMLGGAMKMLEKEMQREMQKGINHEQAVPLKTNFELYVNGQRIAPENIRVTRKIPAKPEKRKIIQNPFSQENMKKFSELPKQEPSTNVRRLSNKVIYEIEIPGVASIKDISITKLENSIEIKAVAKDKAYAKIIPIDLPLKAYKLDKDKLVLELGVKN